MNENDAFFKIWCGEWDKSKRKEGKSWKIRRLGQIWQVILCKILSNQSKTIIFSSFGFGRSRTRTENLSNLRKKILFSSFARKEEEPGHGSCQHKDIKDESIRFVTDGFLWWSFFFHSFNLHTMIDRCAILFALTIPVRMHMRAHKLKSKTW